MSFLTTNYKENKHNDFGAIPTGTYEMVIKQAQEKATPSGRQNLELQLVVRNDLDKVPALAETNAKYHNRVVFAQFWTNKQTGQYDTSRFQYVLEAAQIPEGTVINSIDDFMKLITDRPVKAYVKKEKDDYNSTDTETVYRNTVAPWGFEKTDFPDVNHQYKKAKSADPFASNGNSIDISNDDLPF